MRGDGFEPERDPTVGIVPEKRGAPLLASPRHLGRASPPETISGRAEKLSFFIFFPPLFSPLPLDVSLMPAARRAADSCGT